MQRIRITSNGLAFFVAVAAAVSVCGCRSQSEPASDAAGKQANTQPVADGSQLASVAPVKVTQNAGGEIQLVEADLDVYQRTLAKHAGKVVLVDFWATWCVPCKKRLPKILGYGRKYAQKGLAVVTVGMDDPESPAAALDFLKSVDAKTDNLISKWGAGTDSTKQFKIDSALPYYKLYDRQGKLRYQFSGVPEGSDHVEPLDQIEPRLQQLLQEESSR